MKYVIEQRVSGSILFFAETESLKCAVESAVRSRANLNRANLEGIDLTGAHLEGAHLKGANLERANLKGANLGGANLGGADLSRVDLRGAKHGIPVESHSVAIRLMLMGVMFPANVFKEFYNGVCWNEIVKMKFSLSLLKKVGAVWPELVEELERRKGG